MALSGAFTSSFQNLILDALGGNNILDPLNGKVSIGLWDGDPGEGGASGAGEAGRASPTPAGTGEAPSAGTTAPPLGGRV